MTDTPQCDALNQNSQARDAIADFLEWLNANQMLIHRWTTDVTDLAGCPHKNLLGLCSPTCPTCDGSGYIEVKVADRYLPVAKTHDRLIMDYLGIDTVALEAERRAILSELWAGSDG